MDIDEEQPEDEGRGIPAAGKRGRFENERSGSVSQGEGAYQQHTEDGEPGEILKKVQHF